MTVTLELTADQERLLRAKAAAAGQEPAAYLLAIATGSGMPTESDSPTATTAYDLFNGLLGSWSSGGSHLSENCGEGFAAGMAQKRAQGHL